MEIPSWGTKSPSNATMQSLLRCVENGEYDRAVREILRFERHSGDVLSPGERGEISHLASICLYKVGRYKEALGKATAAFDMLKETSDNEKVAQIQDVLGRISLSLGDLTNAELHLRDAVSTYRRVGNHTELLKCYNVIARVYFVRTDFEKCIEYLHRAEELSKRVGDARANAWIHGNLGTVFTLLGEWRKAQEELDISFRYHQASGDELNLCRVLLSLGFLSCLRRDFRGSEDFLVRACELARKGDFLRELAIYHEYAGQLARSQGDARTAKSHFLKALGIGRKAAPEGDINNQTYRLLAELEVAQEKFQQALISCHKSLRVSKSLEEKTEEGAAYRILGQIYSHQGDKRRACGYFRKGISLLQHIGAKYELALTYLEAGRSGSFDYYRRLGFLGDAESLFRDLESKYHIGLVNLAVADLLLERKDYPSAEVFLVESERLFKESKDEK
ncbi:MAG: tetratricopeptide repeat protein, partial [Candidatus Zixiibacteriota bacterium]